MQPYLVLLRGINVGGKNKVPMAQLRACLQQAGFLRVSTYIASGNVLLASDMSPHDIKVTIERLLPHVFTLDSEFVKVAVLSRAQLYAVVENKPAGFGEQPDVYHSDAIFLMDIDTATATAVFAPREGVDTIWPGDGVIYSQRLSSARTKSRLNRIIGTVPYQSMTIRNWNTVTQLLERI